MPRRDLRCFIPVAADASARGALVLPRRQPFTPRRPALWLACLAAWLAQVGALPAGPAPRVTFPADIADPAARPVASVLEAQVALARLGISCGPIDGVAGAQTASALAAFQQSRSLPATGRLDAATREALILKSPALRQVTLGADDLAQVRPLSPTWLGKSRQAALDYPDVVQLVAERAHASAAFIRKLNASLDWSAIKPGAVVLAPDPAPDAPLPRAAVIRISLSEHTLEARDASGALIAHFPVSIARLADKRPVGELHVTVVIANPDYTFDPALFPESPEAKTIDHKLILPPGPRNPVGLAWIGLDRTGYGIHGTTAPENVGRTESHGCFRLANWDALTLLSIATVGLPVIVEK